MPAVVFRTCGTIRGGCFALGGEGSVREDTSVSENAAVKLFSIGVDDFEVEMSPCGPGGKRLRSFIYSARSFNSRSENFAASKIAGNVAIVHSLYNDTALFIVCVLLGRFFDMFRVV